MTPRTLRQSLTCYRIGDPNGEWPIFSGEGARTVQGRWHRLGQNPIYASEHYSTAMLELLARVSVMPPNQHFVTITVERGASYEVVTDALVPGWHEVSQNKARRFGAQWFAERRSLILFVPSVVARVDSNILINPDHAEFGLVRAGRETPVWWDKRLFA